MITYSLSIENETNNEKRAAKEEAAPEA